jgi:hypothetical protein
MAAEAQAERLPKKPTPLASIARRPGLLASEAHHGQHIRYDDFADQIQSAQTPLSGKIHFLIIG